MDDNLDSRQNYGGPGAGDENAFVEFKTLNDDFEVVFEVTPTVDVCEITDERQRRIAEGLASVDEQLEENQLVLDRLNADIDRLTNQADTIDYMVAVASGVITGVIDIVFVGEFSLETANEWGNDKVNNFVVKIAKQQGYPGDDLAGAVQYLEKKFPIAADKASNAFGSGLQHHLRDFSHHPTPIGLFFSFLTQFTGKVYGTDTAGMFIIVPLELKEKDRLLLGRNFHEKIVMGVINWFFHMVSDMAGSSGSILDGKTGTGLPGPLVSLLKEISALPIFRKMDENGRKEFSVTISKLFNGTLLGEHDEAGKIIKPLKFDLRTEIGVYEQLGKQAIPVIINECVVRGFYFIRRLSEELKEIRYISDLKNIHWKRTLPAKNRTITRMLTISTGTMTAIDLADAAIEAAVKGGATPPTFLSNMILRVNFVGIGRFAVAIGTDVGMGIKRSRLRNERIVAMNRQIFLLNGKMFYKQAEMWISAENTEETLKEIYGLMEQTVAFYIASCNDIKASFRQIGGYIEEIRKQEDGGQFLRELEDILTWG